MTRDNYILNPDHSIRKVSLEEWAEWFENSANRIIKQEQVGPYWVSTVFLGIDHNFSMEGPPLLFETMIFREGWRDLYCDRYSTYEEALAGHAIAVYQAQEGDFGNDNQQAECEQDEGTE